MGSGQLKARLLASVVYVHTVFTRGPRFDEARLSAAVPCRPMEACGRAAARQPAIYINHGGGPLPLLGQQPSVANFLSSYAASLPAKPAAVLIVTAHWEARVTTVSNADRHRLLFDYQGFPPETYAYSYPAPGSPAVAARVCEVRSRPLMSDAGRFLTCPRRVRSCSKKPGCRTRLICSAAGITASSCP